MSEVPQEMSPEEVLTRVREYVEDLQDGDRFTVDDVYDAVGFDTTEGFDPDDTRYEEDVQEREAVDCAVTMIDQCDDPVTLRRLDTHSYEVLR